MIDEIQLESEERMANSVEHTREELVTIRTGRANPSMFNGVVAEYYGVPTPITQMSSIIWLKSSLHCALAPSALFITR